LLATCSNQKKRLKQMKRMESRGKLVDEAQESPFQLFLSSTAIRFCYYADSHKVLGQTFGMCVLQDFDALTPNLLARTIETVEGGGLIILLLKNMQSLRQLYSLSMVCYHHHRHHQHSTCKSILTDAGISGWHHNHVFTSVTCTGGSSALSYRNWRGSGSALQ
jgi:N-acetyltransferase 10